MSDKTQAIINYVSSTIVNVKQQCLTSAAAAFVLKIQNADKVVIHGLTSNNTGTAVRNCAQSNDIEVKSIYGNLARILDTAIQASPSQDNMKKTFIATLTSAININVVTTCFSNAIAAIQLDISNVGGTVTFDNVRVTTRATAVIASCIQKVAVHVGGSDMSMQDYIAANVGWMSSVTGLNSHTTETSQVSVSSQTKVVKPPPMDRIFQCPENIKGKYAVWLIVVWILTVLFGLVAAGRIVYYKL